MLAAITLLAAMGAWPSATALQYCGGPGSLQYTEPSAYNDWTVVDDSLNQSTETLSAQLAQFSGKPFWGYMSWITPESPGPYYDTIWPDSNITHVDGSRDKATETSRGRVCSLLPSMQNYILSGSQDYRAGGIEGLFMDMAWVGWNDCVYNYDAASVSAFRTWLQESFSAELLPKLGISDVANFDIRSYAQNLGATNTSRANRFNPVINLYHMYQNRSERDLVVQLAQQSDSFTLNRPNASMFIVLDALGPTVRHETFIGRYIEGGDNTRRYPTRNMIMEFKLFSDQGKRLWSSNSPHFVESYMWKDNLLFMAETYAAGGIGHFPTTRDDQEGAQTCSVHGEEAWLQQGDAMLAPLFAFVSAHPELYGLRPTGDVALLYPLESYLYGQVDTAGWSETQQKAYLKQDEAFVGAGQLLQDLHIPYRVFPFAGGGHFPNRYPLSPRRLERYDVVVLPDGWALSSRQIRALQSYVRRGGHLVTLYKAGTHDLLFRDRYNDRPTWNSRVNQSNSQHLTLGQGTIASTGRTAYEQQYYFYPEQRASIRATMTALSPELAAEALRTTLPATVNLIQYESSDGALVYHLLNYDYSRDNDAFTEPGATVLRIPLPDTVSASPSATLYRPGEADQVLTTRLKNHTLIIDLPSFQYYGVLKIE